MFSTAKLAMTGAIQKANYSDNFNRADSTTTLGANWTNQDATNMGINGNSAYPAAYQPNLASYISATNTDDMQVTLTAGTLQSASPQGDASYAFLGSNSTGECAVGILDNINSIGYISSATSWVNLISVVNSGGFIGERASGALTWTAGDTFALKRVGNVYSILKNNAGAGITWTDSGNIVPRDLSHRIVGIGGNATTGYRRIDAWAAIDL